MSINGRWEGKLLDASGATASLVITVAERAGRLDGDFSLYFLSESGGCCGPERRLAQSGAVSGSYDKTKGRISVQYKTSIGGESVDVALDGSVRDAANHARRAIVGCYRAKQSRALTLEFGAAVLWQYAS